ncbi:MAG: hypothetical protein IPP44_22585 [Ideonella sp.]|nr:hypothetical protein [Ideonella sp.]
MPASCTVVLDRSSAAPVLVAGTAAKAASPPRVAADALVHPCAWRAARVALTRASNSPGLDAVIALGLG